MAYHHLTERERYHIEIYLNKHFSLRKIAIALGRSVSTVTREIARCKMAGFECYIADYRRSQQKRSIQTQRQIVATSEIFIEKEIQSRADFRLALGEKRYKNQSSSNLQLDLS